MDQSSSEAEKEARRQKIKQLEASLFGGTQDSVTTGLPELQRVDEYSAQFGLAERTKPRRKESALPNLKKQAKKIFFPDPARRKGEKSGGKGYEALVHSDNDEEEEDFILEDDRAVVASPQQQQQQQQQPSQALFKSRRRSSATTTNSTNLLKSEVEQLDHSIKHLVSDPKKEVLENLKKRHGFSRSPSFDPSSSNNSGVGFGSVTNVGAAPNAGLSRASLLDNGDDWGRLGTPPDSLSGRRSRSMVGLATEATDSPDRRAAIQRLDPRFANQSALAPPSSPSLVSGDEEDSSRLSAVSPSSSSAAGMPEIKASLPVRGMKKDALQPLPIPIGANATKVKKKKSKKKFSLGLGSKKGSSSNDYADNFTNVAAMEDGLPRASRLPSLGPRPPGPLPPSIAVESSPRQRRDPTHERLDTRGRGHSRSNMDLNSSTSSGGFGNGGNGHRSPLSDSAGSASSSLAGLSSFRRGSGGGNMVSFDGIERPSSAVPSDTFKDVPRDVMDDVPDAFDDIPQNTFDAIPTDVFDAIPAAVNERESRRLQRLQEEARRKKEEKERSARAAEIYLREKKEEQKGEATEVGGGAVMRPEVAQQQQQQLQQQAPPPPLQAPSPLPGIDPSAAAKQKEGERAPPAPQAEGGASNGGGNISLFTALFPHAVAVDRRDQVESDFMFAVFIQEKEQRTATAGAGAQPGAPNPRRPPTPDPNDPDVGHFCAPWVEGFCEANFCIFHHPVAGTVRPATAAAAATATGASTAPSAPPLHQQPQQHHN